MTNHDLARAATDKLWKQDRQTFESVSTIIADTYAPAMAELAMYEKLFLAALRNVDRVFQRCGENPNPILPDFCKLGEDKFVAVVRLAEKYAQQEAELERLRRQVKIGEESTNVCYYEMGDYYYCEFCSKSHRDQHKLVHHADCPHNEVA